MYKQLLSDIPEDKDAKLYGIRMTSGTTGGSPLMMLAHYPKGAFYRFSTLQRPIICSGSLSARLANALFFSHKSGVQDDTALLLEAKDLTPGLEKVLVDFKPDSFLGFPSVIAKVLHYIKDKKTLENIVGMRLSGEFLTTDVEKLFRESMPNAEIRMLYSSTETGAIASQSCEHLPINFYHPMDGVEIEIIDQDDQGVGEVVISRQLSPSVKLDRFIVGDMGRFHIDKVCPCGNPVTLEVLGRKGYDYIKLAGAILRQEEFARVMSELHRYVSDYRIVASSVVSDGLLRGCIEITIFPTEELQKMKEKAKFIQKAISTRLFLTASHTLDDLVVENHFLPLQIVFTSEAFQNGHKEIKLVVAS